MYRVISGDLTFYIPRRFHHHDEFGDLVIDCVIVPRDGYPTFESASVRHRFGGLAPLEMQRIPWAQLMTAAVRAHGTRVRGRRSLSPEAREMAEAVAREGIGC